MSVESKCRMNNWDSQLEQLINDQINIELYASHVYTSLYAYLSQDYIGFKGVAKYAKKSSEEEKEHADKFIEYQTIRGGSVEISYLEEPNIEYLKVDNNKSILLKVFEYILDLEQKVYESIINISNKCDDPGLEDFLDDFIKEQLHSQYELSVQITKLKLIGNDGLGLIEFDESLN